jgi:hypothetical protein
MTRSDICPREHRAPARAGFDPDAVAVDNDSFKCFMEHYADGEKRPVAQFAHRAAPERSLQA